MGKCITLPHVTDRPIGLHVVHAFIHGLVYL